MLSEKPNKAGGFTLIEVMVTVTIVGVASAIGMPMMSQFIENAAVSTQADVMLDTLNYTRSEAVKRNTRVTMCRSTTGTGCTTAVPAGDWRGGWIVFVDDKVGGTIGTVDAGESVLRVQSAFSGRGELLATGNIQNYVSYASTGQTRYQNTVGHVGEFYFCGKSVKAKRRKIALTAGTGWVGSAIIDAAPTCTAA
ncbi:MAG TPA: GspH/FimT family pseudopilin [Telluria sp.]|jgi:type IV fimbrial biogenesis protein FimT